MFPSYDERDAWLDRLDVRTKLAWLAVVVTLAVAAGGPAEIALVGGVVAVAQVVSGRGLRPAARMALAFVPFLLVVCLVQALAARGGTPGVHAAPGELRLAGALTGLAAVERLYVIALASLQFVGWTHPTDLALGLVALRVPYRYAMLVGLGLRFLPVLEAELAGIFAAQEARGLDLRGPARRALAFAPVLVPLCLRTLRRANEVSLALELRAFGLSNCRTFDRELRFGRADAIVLGAIVLLAGAGLLR